MKLISYRSKKTINTTSRIDGTGFFACENIDQGEIVGIRAGHIVHRSEEGKFLAELGDCSLQIAEDFYLYPSSREEIADISHFINHSCDPNIGMDGQITFIAMRDIKSGEELFIDYAMFMFDEFEMICSCGSALCRGVVTGHDWLRKDLQERYGDYFSYFLQKKFLGKATC